jgi:3-oxoacyl-[acyl-carrier-protein] synthase II
VGEGYELLRLGRAERVLAGGYDALCQMVFSGFDSLQALSPGVCRPFDARRDGLALGEGAGVVALETLESARGRGAVILAEVASYASVLDAHHLTQPHPEGDAALTAMKLACEKARLSPDDIGYVNAHGTGTPLNDSAEAKAIARWAGARASTLPVSSTKAGIGHLLGAAGAVEAVVCLMALREQWLPPETAFEAPDPACTFPVVRHPQDAAFEFALSNSFGFGGVNATLIFRRWH